MKRGHSSDRESNLLALNRLKTDTDFKSAGGVVSSNLTVPIFLNLDNVAFSRNDFIRGITIPKFLNADLAEDIGIQIGDGGIFVYKEKDGDTHYRIECYGHINEDISYFNTVIIPLKQKLFNVKPDIKIHKTAGTCYIRINSKAINTFYHYAIGLPRNNKCKIITIPKIILNSSNEILAACIRGITDTDFSLSFGKRGNDYSYPILHLTSASKKLIFQLHYYLKRFGIFSNVTYDYGEYDFRTGKTYIKNNLFVNGNKNFEYWIEHIGFCNPVHATKYLIWKRYGYCPPKTTLKQRIDILKDNTYLRSLGKQ